MGTEEHLLAESIRTTISKTSDVLWRLLPLQPRSLEEAEEDPTDELIDLDGELSDHLKKLYRDVAILAERMDLPLLCRKISETFNEHRDTLTQATNQFDEYMECRSFREIRGIFDSIDVMIDGKDISSVAVLQNILENTRKILVDAGIPVPKTEKEIYDAVGKVLNYAFHDVIPQFSLPRPLKQYKPEFAIKSVKSLVEYKFARSEKDLKTKVDELYTDTRGYVNDSGYSTFFAVIYCHDQYAHIEKVKREFQTSEIGPYWRIVLVHGGGAA
ncbi:hypothetical protein [Agrobacterium tumefaciens]|uniref:PD-(D/E)XK nuclease domain-containing protein n=1 Tax=Agrobacterium tumefaciens TaxID=358 RepID=UPI000DDFBF9F|nr:hypothetical protein [Agrobacterium tumefaciens]MBP2537499.1 hypothetical protein [Agrobacterium tumefaciens]MDP9791023.1 hypothetical protein [Agrobacterium tumefaciens]